MKKLVVSLTVLALLLSLSMMVMAAEQNDDWLQKRYDFQKDYIKQQLDEGVITQQQADYMLQRLERIKNYYEENGTDYGVEERYQFQKDYINQQLEKGLITEKEAEYMLERLEAMKEYYQQNGDYATRMPCGRPGAGPMMHSPGMMGGFGFGPMMHGPGMMYGPGMMRGGRGFGPRGR